MAARKFIDLEEAAKMLGVSSDTLNEMRERQKIYGYRDGGSWKFKPEDVEKLIADREAAEQEGEFAELDDDPDSILLSEVELGGSDESTSSTIIGGRPTKNSAESDIQLAPLDDAPAPRAPQPPKPETKASEDSDIGLGLELGGDSKTGSDILKEGSGVSPMFDELDTLDLDMQSAADSGISSKALTPSDSALELGGDAGGSDIALGSDALKLEGSGPVLGAAGDDDAAAVDDGPGLELESPADGGSAIDLTGDEDGDLVLGGSSHGGDLSRAGDSGISLLDPADSGLSLESAPLQLGGSSVESLELGEDEELEVETPPTKGAAAAKSAAGKTTVGKSAPAEPDSDDDFLLTPLEEAGAEESSDSGSQVIALDTDVEFGEAAASTIESGGGGLLEEDLGEGLSDSGVLGGAAALSSTAGPAGAAAAAAGVAGAVAAPEAPFSGWNVASLVLCTLMLILVGMFMFDLLRNMWSWNSPYSVNSSMMDMILSWFEK